MKKIIALDSGSGVYEIEVELKSLENLKDSLMANNFLIIDGVLINSSHLIFVDDPKEDFGDKNDK